jgi:hypothetical protein
VALALASPPVARASWRLRHAARSLVLLLAGACSMTERDNRRTLELLDRELTPPSTAGRVALAPLALPIGICAFAADLAVVHPIATIDDAWLDTRDLLWTPSHESPLRKVLFVPFAALATPFVFAGDWFGRWLLPISPHRDGAESATSRPAESRASAESRPEGGR